MAHLVKISEAASMALHTMILLACRGVTMTSRDLAAILGGSENHLSKVLQRLARAGLLNSVRGPRGGFFLARPADEVSLLEVYEAIEGPLVPTGCLLDRPVCGGMCILGDLLSAVDGKAARYLKEKKLSDFADIFTEGNES
ncbi:MAG: Rrf2 family transcriptional regulator [Proteobacteria bacterium]|nr:Rrf2 family transcriptional regulator [Pseudomonadota bacterium]